MTQVERLFAEEAELSMAKQMVNIIESLIQSEHWSVDEACSKTGIGKSEYDRAKSLIEA